MDQFREPSCSGRRLPGVFSFPTLDPWGSWPFSVNGEARATNGSPRRTAVAGFPYGRADASPCPAVASRSPGAGATAVATRRAFRGDPSAFEEARQMPWAAVRWGFSPALDFTWALADHAAPRSAGRTCGGGRRGKAVRYLFLGHPPGLRCFASYSSTAAPHSARSFSGIRCWFCSWQEKVARRKDQTGQSEVSFWRALRRRGRRPSAFPSTYALQTAGCQCTLIPVPLAVFVDWATTRAAAGHFVPRPDATHARSRER
jgi:hypothetical protein